MNNDGLNFAISTGGGLFAWWLAAFSAILPILWVAYVVILIAIKLTELYQKNAQFRRGCDWLANRFRRGRHG
ncbi:hypothetical protein EGK70_005525 [Alcaligenes aquatilis]|uniref:hypothetical protein n=1 Tax=Alcaligenes aquatilis TaxID=323284 RepID=UPI000F683B68|nr:hypothetical protein [Alcaligenes aquatilis]QXR36976.1 hypothetical protein EGK70_005525 [Alcaligenes aquatilis]